MYDISSCKISKEIINKYVTKYNYVISWAIQKIQYLHSTEKKYIPHIFKWDNDVEKTLVLNTGVQTWVTELMNQGWSKNVIHPYMVLLLANWCTLCINSKMPLSACDFMFIIWWRQWKWMVRFFHSSEMDKSVLVWGSRELNATGVNAERKMWRMVVRFFSLTHFLASPPALLDFRHAELIGIVGRRYQKALSSYQNA